ncbi:SDR family oxidoreductase [Bermanella marisrubri]|uniref:Putative 3-oxoacyl-[acyl-carrier protein] reductase n=1 Tax=Bermanella marisrubri TaxID=207949 RepID=Q1N4D7_9GAMM|nr:SDR family oxidoreductase [Bermanella marisrubri]EAT12928.1 putative 3-oxoacyl-[acyl-carrier protein] reductase [Oceanobacter sp. RED65] [Bermanella marisrubri]QIZ82941.1 SDR family oxidoreductase [Bermanella marisrubri]
MSVIWITGASSGIGEALAKYYARQTSHSPYLVLSARREAELNRVKDECIKLGLKAEHILVLPLDVLDTESMPSKVDVVLAAFGQIDMLINNAGISQRSLCLDTDLDVYKKLLDVDVLGQIALTKAVLPHMVERKSGHIAVTSSVAGKVGVKWRTGYCAAKHAVMGFFDALRAEVTQYGIQVSTITPGFIKTDVSKNAVSGNGEAFGQDDDDIKNGMDVDNCASIIARQLAKGKKEIVVGEGLSVLAVTLKRFFPELVFKMVAKRP